MDTAMDLKQEQYWQAAEQVRDRIAGFLRDNWLDEAYTYISETRTTVPQPAVFTFAAIARCGHASVKISASQIDRNRADLDLFALLVANCLYQRLQKS
jgi:hypothetical protein